MFDTSQTDSKNLFCHDVANGTYIQTYKQTDTNQDLSRNSHLPNAPTQSKNIELATDESTKPLTIPEVLRKVASEYARAEKLSTTQASQIRKMQLQLQTANSEFADEVERRKTAERLSATLQRDLLGALKKLDTVSKRADADRNSLQQRSEELAHKRRQVEQLRRDLAEARAQRDAARSMSRKQLNPRLSGSEVVEEIAWFASQNQSPFAASVALDRSIDSLIKACQRAGRHDLAQWLNTSERKIA